MHRSPQSVSRAVSVLGLWHKGADGRDLYVLQLLLLLHLVCINSMDLVPTQLHFSSVLLVLTALLTHG